MVGQIIHPKCHRFDRLENESAPALLLRNSKLYDSVSFNPVKPHVLIKWSCFSFSQSTSGWGTIIVTPILMRDKIMLNSKLEMRHEPQTGLPRVSATMLFAVFVSSIKNHEKLWTADANRDGDTWHNCNMTTVLKLWERKQIRKAGNLCA